MCANYTKVEEKFKSRSEQSNRGRGKGRSNSWQRGQSPNEGKSMQKTNKDHGESGLEEALKEEDPLIEGEGDLMDLLSVSYPIEQDTVLNKFFLCAGS